MSASKAKGTRFETAIVDYLRSVGHIAMRKPLTGSRDQGDIALIIDGQEVTIEAKNCRATELAAWVDQADAEARHAGSRFGVVWHHRRGKASPADGFVTMSGKTFVEFMRWKQEVAA